MYLTARPSRAATTARLALSAAVGFAAGAVTEWSVPHLSFSLEPLSNTAAPWVLVAFVVALTGRRTAECLLLAVVAFVALVAGFYVAQAIRGWAVSRHQIAFWCLASAVAGPLVGVAAGWLRRGSASLAAIGAGAIGGVLVGEAIHGLRDLRFSTAPAYWRVELVVGLVFALGVAAWRSRQRLAAAVSLSVVSCAIVALGTLAAYQVP